MANINIKDLLGNGEMVYDTLFTEGTFEWFKSNEDAYIYVRNTETGRCSRYNAEAQNGKRISVDVYESNKARAKARLDEENGDALTEEELESATREVKSAYEQSQMEEAVEIEITELEPHEGETVYHDEPIERIDIEAAVEATEESQTTEETKQIAKEFAPKKKRTRKSKDIAYEGHEVTLTAKQVDFIRHLSDTCFWENGLDSKVWVDCLCDDIKGQFEGKPMTVGAMISTLCEKGLGIRTKEKVNNRTATYFELTQTGKMVSAELGLN